MQAHGERVPVSLNDWVSGQLSANVAQVVFTACEATSSDEPLYVVELGASCGLFAKLFLDAFKLMCRSAKRDFYDRLTYIATDASPSTVSDWRERGVFVKHGVHVRTLALQPTDPLPADLRPLAVIYNRVLGALPAVVVRRSEAGEIEQHPVCEQRVEAEAVEAEAVEAEAVEAPQKSPLGGSSTAVEREPMFLRASGMLDAELREILVGASNGERRLYNRDAFACLARVITSLGERGFVVVNDCAAVQRFDAADERGSIGHAHGLSFSVLERKLEQLGAIVIRPSGDPSARPQSRIMSTTALPEVALTFERHFGSAARVEAERTLSLARQHVRAGRRGEALDSYKKCLEANPWDWTLLGETSEFLNREVRDYTSALAFARAAVSLNPISSTWLWNLLGEAFFRLGRWSEAHEAYARAERIDPTDSRTNAALAESYLQQQEFDCALQTIATGLSRDGGGIYRERLLETQRAALAGMAAKSLQPNAATTRSYERHPNQTSPGTGTESEPA